MFATLEQEISSSAAFDFDFAPFEAKEDRKTSDGASASDLCSQISGNTRYHQNPVATLQLCVGRRCLIYQLIHSDGDVPDSLVDFLSVEDYTFVGVNIPGDLEKLEMDYWIGGGAKAVDLRRLAATECDRKDLNSAGLKNLVRVQGCDGERGRETAGDEKAGGFD